MSSQDSAPAVRRVGIIIPTYNAEPHWPELGAALVHCGIPASDILIIDSSSKDRTRELAARDGFQVVCIPQTEFGHGATRQAAAGYFPKADLIVYMTQDAIPQDAHAIRTLCAAMDDPSVGVAYGRQAPRSDADPIERHARLFNYPKTSHVRTFESRHTLGIKAAFCSNSFAVYRRSALQAVGGFPRNVIFAEDSIVAARMLITGWRVAYQADAVAVHSHPLGFRQEFSRYFDIGAHHAREAWLQKTFGTAGPEGKLFLKSEMRYLLKHGPAFVPQAIIRTVLKLSGYRLGKVHKHLPLAVRRALSGYPNFWNKSAEDTKAACALPEKNYPEATTSVSG